MSWEIRLVLIVGALLTAVFMLRKIRRSKIEIGYSIFWILFSAGVLILSIFPQIAFWAVDLLKMQSPINVVYLVMIFVLIMKLFSTTVKLSELENKINALAQQMAINRTEQTEERRDTEKG